MKKALLARPSSLIVQNMRRFMTTLGFEPTRLSSASELSSYDSQDVACIVISTALTSTVKESYCQIVMKVKDIFPGKPIFIASFADIKRSKVIVNAKFRDATCNMTLLSMEEAWQLGEVDFGTHCVLITNDEIKEEPKLTQSLKRLRSLLAVSV